MMVPQDNYDDKELIEFLGHQESQNIDWGNNFKDELVNRIEEGKILRGDPLPWAKTSDKIRFREGEVSIWAGMNGHKKSMLLGYVMMHFAKNARVGISSFEMPVVDTLERLTYQAAGCRPSKAFAAKFADWNHERICYYDQLDTVPAERVLGSMFYMAKEMGCKHIMVDSLTKCGLPSGDRDAEKRFIDTLSAAAKALNVHIHLVAHVRKPHQGGEQYIPTKFDIRGAGELTDLVDNLLIVWMDKKKEAIKKKVELGMSLSGEEDEYLANNSDQRLICAKQRRGEWEGTVGLWFDNASLQFLEFSGQHPDHLI
jgi:twinkle protein